MIARDLYNAGYREGQNDAFRGLSHEKPNWVRDPVRGIFVFALLFFSLFLAATHYKQTVRTLHMIQVVGANIDEAVFVIRLERLKEEAENTRLRLQIEKRIRDLSPPAAPEYASR